MDMTSFIGVVIVAIVAAGWIFCALVSVVADMHGGLVRWWSRASA